MSAVDPKEMMEGMRAQLEADAAEGKLAGITVEDLEDAISHPEAGAAIAETLAADANSQT